MDESQHTETPNLNWLLLYFLSTFAATVVTTITAMMMALGTGLASTPDEPVAQISQAFWAIGGLSFLPSAVLMIVLIATHRRTVAVALAFTIIVAGLLTAAGWFIDSGGEMPGTSTGDVMVILVIVVPLLAGGLMLWRSGTLKD